MTPRECCIALNRLPGIGFARYQALVEYFGSPGSIVPVSVGEAMQIPRIGRALAESLAAKTCKTGVILFKVLARQVCQNIGG